MMRTEKFFVNGHELDVELAENFFDRLRGLMFRKNLDAGEGLLLAPCNSVHMSFMRFSIDIVYLDEDFRVKKLVRNLRPWIGFSACFKAWGTLELASGEIERLNLAVGQKLSRR